MNVLNRNVLGLMLAMLTYSINGTLAHAAPPEAVPNSRAGLPAEDPVSDLMRVLDEETEIATRTKLNIDFVPGMVTVLHGKDLLAKGVRTVYEALGLVPGIELSMAGDGQVQFLMRGLGKTFASTKIKFLLNGVDLNSTLGPNIVIHTIPIEQVDRIEVVRGPGSAIYGEHALAGVVDVITVTQKKSAFVRYGNVDGSSIGAVYSAQSADSKTGLSLNLAQTSISGADVMAGKDKLAGTPWQSISNAPGPSNERESNRSAILNLHYRGTTLVAQHVAAAFGDHFGVNDVLPEERSDMARSLTFNTIELRQPWRLGRDMRADMRVAWTHFVIDVDGQQLYPAGYRNEFPATGVRGGPHYEGTRRSVKSTLEIPVEKFHLALLGAEYADVIQGDTWNQRNYDPNRLAPYLPPAQVPEKKYTGADNWLKEGLERRILSAYLQDQYTGVDKLSITAGVRIDHYNDVGNAVTPRIGAVYQLSSRQTLKLQYSDAFRPPSFLELYARNNPVVNGNTDITPERMHNLEAGYIYNSGQHIFRATAFSSAIKHIIIVDSTTRKYQNGGGADIRGFELEAMAPVRRDVKVDANISVQSSDTRDGLSPLWGAARTLANAGVLYQMASDRFMNVQYRYAGARERETTDARSALDGYQTFDLTFSANKFWLPALSLRAGVRNMFDARVVYPAPKATYPDDYPRPGRQWWLAASYRI